MTDELRADPAARREIQAEGERFLPRICQQTTPLFAPDGQGQPVQVASGVILRVAGARLLITASHAVHSFGGLGLNVGDEFLTISGVLHQVHSVGSTPGSAEDKVDVSVIRLDGDVRSRLNDVGVLTIEDLDISNPLAHAGPFILSGFPSRRNEKGLVGDVFTTAMYSLLMPEAEQSVYRAIAAHRDVQLVLSWNPRDVWTAEQQVTAPNLEGVSGGGVWSVGQHPNGEARSRLAAIAIEQHRKGKYPHVLATRTRRVLSLIHDKHPDLRKPLEDALSAHARLR